MSTSLIIGMIIVALLLVILLWRLGRKASAISVSGQSTVDGSDYPRTFGYKTAWYAIATSDTKSVLGALRLSEIRQTAWNQGVDLSYESEQVFVTPPVDGWTLVTGGVLAHHFGTDEQDQVLDSVVALSRKFGNAQFYATHRVIDLHAWVLAKHGELLRAYAYIGERGETIWNIGERQSEEVRLGFDFFNSTVPEASTDEDWQHGNLSFPTEESVMQIAREWSVSPTDIDAELLASTWSYVGRVTAI